MSRPPELPPAAAAKVDEMESLEVLGASRQLTIIAAAFEELAEAYDGPSTGLVETTRRLVDYLDSTRGESSQGVSNAVRLMVHGLEAQSDLPVTELRAWIVERVRAYEARSRRWMRELTEHGVGLLTNGKRVLAYDYSSSVAHVLRVANDRGWEATLVLPESRSLSGGHKYVRDLRETGLSLEFVPDSSIGSAVSSCELVLVGAETLSAEGGCYNTVGTFLTALAARYYGVPFYVTSTLIKTDLKTAPGVRGIPNLDLDDTLLDGWEPELAGRVRTVCPDLDYTPPEFVAGLVTEVGLLAPSELQGRAARLLDYEGLKADA